MIVEVLLEQDAVLLVLVILYKKTVGLFNVQRRVACLIFPKIDRSSGRARQTALLPDSGNKSPPYNGVLKNIRTKG